jgi:hypothetical protein
MERFDIKRGDTSPSIRFSLLPDDISLFGGSVRFQMRRINRQTVIDQPAEIITVLPPVVQYNWQAGDTDTADTYHAEFRVEYADGSVETFPNRSFITISVNKDVPDQ